MVSGCRALAATAGLLQCLGHYNLPTHRQAPHGIKIGDPQDDGFPFDMRLTYPETGTLKHIENPHFVFNFSSPWNLRSQPTLTLNGPAKRKLGNTFPKKRAAALNGCSKGEKGSHTGFAKGSFCFFHVRKMLDEFAKFRNPAGAELLLAHLPWQMFAKACGVKQIVRVRLLPIAVLLLFWILMSAVKKCSYSEFLRMIPPSMPIWVCLRMRECLKWGIVFMGYLNTRLPM